MLGQKGIYWAGWAFLMVSVSTCSIPLKSLHMMPDNLFLVFNGQLLVGFSDGLGTRNSCFGFFDTV